MTSRAFLRLLLTGLLAVPTLLAGAVTAPNAAAATHAITIANFAFVPASDTIVAGDTVTWTNTDQAPHDVTVTSGPVAIHSPTITTGQSWTYTFTTPGTYTYICSIHPDMRATLVVRPLPTQIPTTTRAAVPPVAVTRARSAPAPTAAPPPPRTSAAVAAPTTAATSMSMPVPSQSPATSPVEAAASSGGQQPSGLNPLLLVAGLVAGVATLCLLLIGSRPEQGRD